MAYLEHRACGKAHVYGTCHGASCQQTSRGAEAHGGRPLDVLERRHVAVCSNDRVPALLSFVLPVRAESSLLSSVSWSVQLPFLADTLTHFLADQSRFILVCTDPVSEQHSQKRDATIETVELDVLAVHQARLMPP